jgi:hypothetical protein
MLAVAHDRGSSEPKINHGLVTSWMGVSHLDDEKMLIHRSIVT